MKRLNTRPARVALVVGAIGLVGVAVVYAAGHRNHATPKRDRTTGESAVGPLLRLSQGSPLADCPGLPGTELNYAVEPSLAVNPTDPTNLVAAWQQDRSHASRGNVVGYSTDSGKTWTVVVVPGANTCASGQLGVADAWLTFDGGGTAHLASVGGRENDGHVISSVIVNRSTDGGRTWSEPSAVTDLSVYDDKPAITGDPTRRGVVYATWQRSQLGPAPNTASRDDQACSDASGCGPVIFFSRSEDGGVSWSTPRAAALPTDGATAQIDARILVLADGSLRLFFEQSSDPDHHDASGVERHLMVVRSSGGGPLGSQPQEIATVHQYHPFTATGGRFFSLYDEAVASDAQGNLYVVSTENDSAQTSTSSRVALRVSRDGGNNWDPPATIASPNGFATLPSITTSPAQDIAVTWYDFASATTSSAEVTLTYARQPGATTPTSGARTTSSDSTSNGVACSHEKDNPARKFRGSAKLWFGSRQQRSLRDSTGGLRAGRHPRARGHHLHHYPVNEAPRNPPAKPRRRQT